MADHGMQMSLSNTSSDNSSNQQLPPYNINIGGSSSQNPFNIPPPKKPRGRPPGSKNKPKPPLIVTQENDRAMRPVIIEVSAGTDVVEAIIQYALRRRTGISIVNGSGTINKATLRYPLTNSPAVTLHGPFSLLTLTGTFMYPPSPPPPPPLATSSSSSSNPNPPQEANSFAITLAGVQGQIFGGIVGGKVVAGGDVVKVTCSIFRNPELHRAGGVNDVGEEGDDFDDDDDDDDNGDGGGNPNVGGEGGVGSNAGGAGGNESMPGGFNPPPLNLAPSDPSFMHWTHPHPPNY